MELDQVLSRLGAGPVDAVVAVVSAIAIYAGVIVATRIVGLRSFSKMSAFDFAMTVAIGSVIATVGTGSIGLAQGLIAIATLYGGQFSVAWLRQRSALRGLVDNRPRLLMDGTTVLHDQLRTARIADADLRGKLREAGVLQLDNVRAVVLETTGNVSVLAGGELDPALLDGVVGAEHVAQ